MAISSRHKALDLITADIKELETQTLQWGELIHQQTEFATLESLLRTLGQGNERTFVLRHKI